MTIHDNICDEFNIKIKDNSIITSNGKKYIIEDCDGRIKVTDKMLLTSYLYEMFGLKYKDVCESNY